LTWFESNAMTYAMRHEERERFLSCMREKALAFHMAFHKRLGQGSQLQPLDSGVFRHIFRAETWVYPVFPVRQNIFCTGGIMNEFMAVHSSSAASRFKCRLSFMDATMIEHELPGFDGGCKELYYRSPMASDLLRLKVIISVRGHDRAELEVRLLKYVKNAKKQGEIELSKDSLLVKAGVCHAQPLSYRFSTGLSIDIWALASFRQPNVFVVHLLPFLGVPSPVGPEPFVQRVL